MRFQKRRQVPRDRRISRVRQTEFLEARLTPLRLIGQLHVRQEPLHQNLHNFITSDLSLNPAANQLATSTGQVHRVAGRRVLTQHRLFHVPAGRNQNTPLPRFQLTARNQFLFNHMSQRQVQVVAAQH